MQNLLLKEIYGNIVSTVIALVVIVLVYFVIDVLFARSIDSNKQKRRFRVRSFYIACFVTLFLMARIWVEGFTHLLAVLGLVSAALVITNKETIMNFVGWLIINWRGLFTEDDLIQIQNYKGYVKAFGLLYFTLAEISTGRNGDITGRLIRVPNGLVANNALVNYSQTSHLLEQVFTIVITQDCDPEYAIDFMTDLVDGVIKDYYKDKKEYSKDHIKKHLRYLSDRLNLTVKVSIQPKLDKPIGIELTTHYYCFSRDAAKIQQKIWLVLLSKIRHDKQIKLSYTD